MAVLNHQRVSFGGVVNMFMIMPDLAYQNFGWQTNAHFQQRLWYIPTCMPLDHIISHYTT